MRPVSLQNPNLNKGPSSSAEFNKLRNDIQTDITSLFDIVNEQEKAIAESMDHIVRENYFLQNRLYKLEGRLKELERQYQSNNESDKKILTRSFYHASNIVGQNAVKPIHLDTIHGVVSPVVVRSSDKIAYRNEQGRYLLPSNFEATIIESNDAQPIDEVTRDRKYYSVNTNNLSNAFDGDKNSYWVRHVETKEEECVTEVYAILHIKIPKNMSNNVYTNTLILNPSPEYSMSLLDIQYKNANGEWRRIETYPTSLKNGVSVPLEIKEMTKMLFSFPRNEMEEIQIKIKQPYWFVHENKRIFTYGFQDIKIEYREYSNNESEFVTKFELTDKTQRFSSIDAPIVTAPLGCPSINDYMVKHELYFDEGLTEKFNFSSDIFQPVHEVYIKTIMKVAAGEVPIIREMELQYTSKDK